MSKSRYIQTHFWDDTYVVGLDPSEKLLFLYFLTNPLTTISGVYEIQLKRVAFDTGFDQDMIRKVLERFSKDKKMYYRGGHVIITNFVKNQQMNPSVKMGIVRELTGLPQVILDSLSQLVPSLSQAGLLNLTLNEREGTTTHKKHKAIEKLGVTTKQFDLYLLKVANAKKEYKDHIRTASAWIADDLLSGKLARKEELSTAESPY